MRDKTFKGPCKLCGLEDYPLSTDGPEICPACACYPPQKRVLQLRGEIESLYIVIERLRKSYQIRNKK